MFGYSEQLIPKVAMRGLFSYTPPQYQSPRYHLTQELCAALKNAIYVMYERFTTGPFRHALLPCKQ